MSDPAQIAQQFDFPSAVGNVELHGSGIINDTFVVTFTDPPPSNHPRLGRRAILQRINPNVFPKPDFIMHNLAVVLAHTGNTSKANVSEFILPPIYRTKSGDTCYTDDSGQYWRAIGFVEGTVTADILQNLMQAREAGAALGAFHRLLADIPVEKLHDTLPGFHATPQYLQAYDALSAGGQPAPGSDTGVHNQPSRFSNVDELIASRDYCFQQIEKHRPLAGLLYDLQPAISLRVMHGDPKLNNFLFDKKTGKAVSIIDLDTVKPGIIHYDLGDCVRSCCNTGGELPQNIADARFSVEQFEAILEGYLRGAGELFEARDFDLLYDVVKLLPFELALRFFTDYLNGNRYFKVQRPDDNLYRARVQLQLLASIESQEQHIRQAITRCRNAGKHD